MIAQAMLTILLVGVVLYAGNERRRSPVVAWLAHEDCPVSGHTYSVGGGRVARVFVGEGTGYVRTDAPLTLEDVRDHFDEIDCTDDFTLFKNATDELRA